MMLVGMYGLVISRVFTVGQKVVIYRIFDLIVHKIFSYFFVRSIIFSPQIFRVGLPRQSAPARSPIRSSGLSACLPQTTGSLWGAKPQPSWQISTPSVSSTEAFPQVWGLLTLNAGLLWHSSAPYWDQDTAPESSLCSITSHISLQWREADWNDSCNSVCVKTTWAPIIISYLLPCVSFVHS